MKRRKEERWIKRGRKMEKRRRRRERNEGRKKRFKKEIEKGKGRE
jgi:hypothetical protein